MIGTRAVGRVLAVDEDGDMTVEFGNKSFLLNPAICSAAPKKTQQKTQNEGMNAL